MIATVIRLKRVLSHGLCSVTRSFASSTHCDFEVSLTSSSGVSSIYSSSPATLSTGQNGSEKQKLSKRRPRGTSSQPSHMRSSQYFEGAISVKPVPRFHVSPTNWNDARYLNPAPPILESQLLSPLPETSEAAHKGNPYIGMGPGSSNATSLRYAERGLHLHLKNGQRHLGQKGTIYGIPFGKTCAFLTEQQAQKWLTREQRQQNYLEREGGDYSRYLQAVDREGDWEAIAKHALNSNASVAPESKQGLIAQMTRILNGQPFGDPIAPEKKVKAIQEAPAPAAVPAKKGKKGK